MKFLRETLKRDVILRNTLGKMVSSRAIVHVLHQLFGDQYKTADVAPYVRSVNQALRSAQTAEQAEIVWKRLHSEVSHTNKRQLPDL